MYIMKTGGGGVVCGFGLLISCVLKSLEETVRWEFEERMIDD